jgi:D-galactarolactone cycloisomerase
VPGAGRAEVPCYASSVYMADIDTMVGQAVEQVGRGFRAIKIKIGRSADVSGVAADLEAVAAIRRAVGDGVELMVDANGAYDAATAIRVARQLELSRIAWLEEPVPPDDREGYARVHAMTSVPLATGETEFSLFAFRELIERRLIDVVQPDAARCGGVTGMRQIATLAYAHNLAFAPHTGFSGGVSQLAALQVAASAPTVYMIEHMFIDNPVRELFVEPYPQARAGLLPVPTGPGLGLAVDPNRVAAMTAS